MQVENNQSAFFIQSLAWSSQGYIQPTGEKRNGVSFAVENGYGHEEWNNNPNWIWNSNRVFHSEGQGRIQEYAVNGKLGILFIAQKGSKQYALGIACNVFENSKQERDSISRELGLFKNGEYLWSLSNIKRKFKTKQNFNSHWKKNYSWVKWRCESNMYYWFSEPVEIDSVKITGKQKIANHYRKPQAIHSEHVYNIVNQSLPINHDIRDWIANQDFNEDIVSKGVIVPKTKKRKSGKSNKPTDKAYIRYLEQSEILIRPKHQELQSEFILFLKSKGCDDYVEDKNYIDVQFVKDGKQVIAEVKPCEQGEAKYAIRNAIGQILEYQYFHEDKAIPMIVLGGRPSKEQIDFLTKLNIEVCWRQGKTFKWFI